MIKIGMAGTPCTNWSIAKQGRETEPKGTGWEHFRNYLIALEKYNPDYFLYENNKSMATAIKEQITRELGVEPIMINSALVSAQSRQRYYWTNIPGVGQPEDKGILLRDVLESGAVSDKEKAYTLRASAGTKQGNSNILRHIQSDGQFGYQGVFEPVRIGTLPNKDGTIKDSQSTRIYSIDAKSVNLAANGGGLGAKTGLYAVPVEPAIFQQPRGFNQGGVKYDKAPTLTSSKWQDNNHVVEPPEKAEAETQHPIYEVRDGLIAIKGKQYPIKFPDGYYIIRKLTVLECMRLQTIPEDYIMPCSPTQSYKMLGNGWTVDVIAHILSYMPGVSTEPIEVLSMYDGMSCGHIALDKLGANVTRYYATEIDKYAIQTTMANYPDTIQLGDAFQVRENGWRLPCTL